MSETALLVVDVQTGYLDGKTPVYDAKGTLERIQHLITQARQADVPVIYTQHIIIPELDGEIHSAVAPRNNEPVIAKNTPDAFYHTDLQGVLRDRDVRHVVVCGMQTELSIDTTCRRAWSLGYAVTLVADAHTTFDFNYGILTASMIIQHHTNILSSFAELVNTRDLRF